MNERNEDNIKDENLVEKNSENEDFDYEYTKVIQDTINEINKKNKKKNKIAFSIIAGSFSIAFAIIFVSGDYIGKKFDKEIKNTKYELDVNDIKNGKNIEKNEIKEKEISENKENEKKILTIEDVVKKVSPSVVTITASSIGSGFNQGKQGVGTGFIVDKDGTIVTNYHVIENAQDIVISFNNGQEVKAKIIATSPKDDLAILDIIEEVEMPGIAELADNDDINAGQEVIAIGNPLGKEYSGSVTKGIVSSPKRIVEIEGIDREFIQTDAAINPGNSGGPLINLNGEIIGVNSAKKSGENIEGIGFAVPIKYVREILNNLDAYKNENDTINNYENYNNKIDPYSQQNPFVNDNNDDIYEKYNQNKKGKLGIIVAHTQDGVIVLDIDDDSIAKRAGINVNDIIVRFNNNIIRTSEDILNELNKINKGENSEIVVKRAGKEISIQIKF